MSTRVTRPRTAAVKPERRVVVRYDNNELIEHGLDRSEVRLHSTAREARKVAREKAPTAATKELMDPFTDTPGAPRRHADVVEGHKGDLDDHGNDEADQLREQVPAVLD